MVEQTILALQNKTAENQGRIMVLEQVSIDTLKAIENQSSELHIYIKEQKEYFKERKAIQQADRRYKLGTFIAILMLIATTITPLSDTIKALLRQI